MSMHMGSDSDSDVDTDASAVNSSVSSVSAVASSSSSSSSARLHHSPPARTAAAMVKKSKSSSKINAATWKYFAKTGKKYHNYHMVACVDCAKAFKDQSGHGDAFEEPALNVSRLADMEAHINACAHIQTGTCVILLHPPRCR